MKWFKHDSDASNDPKIKKLRKKFGMAGYGVYFNILEIIARKMEDRIEEFGFVPEDWDDDILSIEFDIDTNTLRTMFDFMCDVGLFERKNGRLYNSKIQGRCDDYTARILRNKPNNEESTNSVRTKSDNVPLEENRIEENIQSVRVSSLKSLPGITTGDSYQADGFSPKDRIAMKKRLEKALGLKKTNKWQDFIFGTARDVLTAFEKYQGYKYPDNVLLDEVSKTLAKWYEIGETRETVREMLIAFFEGKKSDAVTVTPNSVFSSHTYNSWKQNKL